MYYLGASTDGDLVPNTHRSEWKVPAKDRPPGWWLVKSPHILCSGFLILPWVYSHSSGNFSEVQD